MSVVKQKKFWTGDLSPSSPLIGKIQWRRSLYPGIAAAIPVRGGWV